MALDEIFDTLKAERKMTVHYYGDMVRTLFMLAAVVMLFTLPFFNKILPVPLPVSIFMILFLGIFAATTNPKQSWTGIANVIISISSFGIFVYYSVDSYYKYSIESLYFWTNQILSVIFLFAIYYSVKTLRGMLLRDKQGKPVS